MQSIIDFILSVLDAFQFWFVVDDYESGMLIRLGVRKRIIKPGLNFCWPLFIDDVQIASMLADTEALSPQTLDTNDRFQLMVTPVATWRIDDIEKYLFTRQDADGTMLDHVSTVISFSVSQTDYDDIFTEDFWKDLTVKCRRALQPYGIYIEKVRYTDLAEIKTVRLITEGGEGYYPDDEE